MFVIFLSGSCCHFAQLNQFTALEMVAGRVPLVEIVYKEHNL